MFGRVGRLGVPITRIPPLGIRICGMLTGGAIFFSCEATGIVAALDVEGPDSDTVPCTCPEDDAEAVARDC